MAHELTIREDGFVEMAFTGARNAIWHGLGNNLDENSSIEEWKKSAGMNWIVKETPVLLRAGGDTVVFPEKKALYRSDNNKPLSIVGEKYKVVQPSEVLEFFRDLVETHGMKLSTAGTLMGGKRFWALADTGRHFQVTDGDHIHGHLMLTTSVDGTMSTLAKFVSTRVVCNNTLSIAVNEKNNNMVKITHKRDFDPQDVKIDLGILDQSWESLKTNLVKLSEVKMDQKATRSFYEKCFFDPNKKPEDQTWGVKLMVDQLVAHSLKGTGQELSKGTAYGALCGATEVFTHGIRNRKQERQFVDSFEGVGDKNKSLVYSELLKLT